MLIDIIKKGATDRSVLLRIIDSGDGTPETGVVFNTSGIDLWYRREGAARTSITEATLSALTDAHSDGGFLHVGDGYYRLDLPDAAFATGANYVDVGGAVTGMVVIGGRVKLVNVDLEDAVRGGMSALPNANADAAGGLPISDAGGLDLDAKIGALTFGTANRVNAQVYGMESNTVTAAAAAADLTTELQSGLATAANLATLQTAVDTIDNLVDDLETRIGTPSNLGGGATIAANLADIEAQTDDIGAAGAGLTALASAANLAIVAGYLDTEIAAIKVTTDKLDDTLEDDAGTYRFTVNSLEQAPAGGGGGATDWSADERTAIRSILGIPGSGTAPADPSTGILDTIRDSVATRASQTSVDDVPTNAELATALGTADDAVLSAIAALNNLSQANIRTALGLATANLDTQLSALAGYVDTEVASILAAVAALNNLSSAQVQTAAAAALTAYDPPTNAEMEARTLVAASYATAASQATIAGYIDTEVAAIISAIAALNNISQTQVLAQVEAALAATIADSVPADGTRPSVSSGIYMLVQFMLERSVSGTTATVRKPDGSTTLFTLTLNDATAPTSVTRA